MRSNATTMRMFKEAGISEGMSVLELGCGQGEVTELLAEIVGKDGKVVAVDNNLEALEKAKNRLRKNNHAHVEFMQADLNGSTDFLHDFQPRCFDIIAGRRVLMYLPNPQQVLSNTLGWLKIGGAVIFEEADSTLCPGSLASMPAHQQGMLLLDNMLHSEGVDKSMGFHLPAVLQSAGLAFQRIWAEAVIDGQGDQYILAELLEILAGRFESSGVATSEQIHLLIEKIEKERDPTAVFISSMRFCAKGVLTAPE